MNELRNGPHLALQLNDDDFSSGVKLRFPKPGIIISFWQRSSSALLASETFLHDF